MCLQHSDSKRLATINFDGIARCRPSPVGPTGDEVSHFVQGRQHIDSPNGGRSDLHPWPFLVAAPRGSRATYNRREVAGRARRLQVPLREGLELRP